MDEIDKKILAFLQDDIPLEPYPYRILATELGITEEEILTRIRTLKDRSIIRRFGAVLQHQKAGYEVNAMVAWKVTPVDADRAGEKMASFTEVTHCYLRDVPEVFAYNLFSMVHARSEKELQEVIKLIARDTDLNDYLILRSIREFKKVSMRYF